MSTTLASISGSWLSSPSSRASSCEHLGVLQRLADRVERADVVLQVGVLGVETLRHLGVVPQIGPRHLRLELGEARAPGGDVEVDLRLAGALA